MHTECGKNNVSNRRHSQICQIPTNRAHRNLIISFFSSRNEEMNHFYSFKIVHTHIAILFVETLRLPSNKLSLIARSDDKHFPYL